MESIRPIDVVGRYPNYQRLFQYYRNFMQTDPAKGNNPIGLSSVKISSFDFLSSVGQTTAKQISAIQTALQNIKSVAEDLLASDTSNSALHKRSVTSSNNEVVTAKAANNASLEEINLQIKSIATKQKNSSAAFVKSSPTSMTPGLNEFKVSVDNQTTSFSFYAIASDTHEQALNKMLSVINSSDSGIIATIESNPDHNSISLEISSRTTGISHAFQLSDVSGNAVSSTGVGNKVQAAVNASYRVNNGFTQTSETNTISLDGGKISATLLKPSADKVTLTPQADHTAITEQVKHLVTDYNVLQKNLSQGGDSLNKNLVNRLWNLVPDTSLQPLGLVRNANHTLGFDDAKLNQRLSASYDQVHHALVGPGGMAANLNEAAQSLGNSPSEAFLNQNSSSYKRYSNYRSSLQLYSQLPNHGLLLNRFF